MFGKVSSWASPSAEIKKAGAIVSRDNRAGKPVIAICFQDLERFALSCNRAGARETEDALTTLKRLEK